MCGQGVGCWGVTLLQTVKLVHIGHKLFLSQGVGKDVVLQDVLWAETGIVNQGRSKLVDQSTECQAIAPRQVHKQMCH